MPTEEEVREDLFTPPTHEHERVTYYPLQLDDIPFNDVEPDER